MKPIPIVDEKGALSVIKPLRGRKKSLRYLLEYAKESGCCLEEQTVALCHGEDEKGRDYRILLFCCG